MCMCVQRIVKCARDKRVMRKSSVYSSVFAPSQLYIHIVLYSIHIYIYTLYIYLQYDVRILLQCSTMLRIYLPTYISIILSVFVLQANRTEQHKIVLVLVLLMPLPTCHLPLAAAGHATWKLDNDLWGVKSNYNHFVDIKANELLEPERQSFFHLRNIDNSLGCYQIQLTS